MEDEKSHAEFLKAIARQKKKKEAEGIEAPIYRRNLPPLPPVPEYGEHWPMPQVPRPRPKARPPEEEAFAPPIAPVPMPSPKPLAEPRPQARPIIVKPMPNRIRSLDLGKLNPLIADDSITMIQCDGANIPVKIGKERRIEEIDLVLGEEEIKGIIRAFAAASGQPITEPLFRASVKGMIFSAVISAFSGSRFTITR